jgi:two-component system sensor histidine kinase RegB
MRWLAALGQGITVVFAWILLKNAVPVLPLFALVGVVIATNLGLAGLLKRARLDPQRAEKFCRVGEGLMGFVLFLDLIILTGMLCLSGGAANPFSVFFLVNMVLGTLLLHGAWPWVLAAAAVSFFWIILFFHSAWVDFLPKGPVFPNFPLGPTWFGLGFALAMAYAGLILVFFMTKIGGELEKNRRQLERVRKEKEQADRFKALSTLAAGAAHELASPLSTIAVVAKDLELGLSGEGDGFHPMEDAHLIRTEVQRCRGILDQMSVQAGQHVGEGLVEVSPQELAEFVLPHSPFQGRVQVSISEEARNARVQIPKEAISQTLRSLAKNALDASEENQEIRMDFVLENEHLMIRIIDEGTGISPENFSKVFDPFFSTKEPGAGMGLGLYLCRTVIEDMGGRLRLDSEWGVGTVASIQLPLSTSSGS